MIITIDGPVASGKSSVAKELAKKLGFYYLYTGLLYRALAYTAASEYGYTSESLASLSDENMQTLFGNMVYSYTPEQGPRIIYKNNDITGFLKQADIDRCASLVSAQPHVRQQVLIFQRKLSMQHNCIADGRDCGTVLFPHAEYKFFLTANPAVRAVRWQKDQARCGMYVSYERALHDIQERDTRDTQRAVSPLKPALDAVIIDNTERSLQETIQYMLSFITLQTL